MGYGYAAGWDGSSKCTVCGVRKVGMDDHMYAKHGGPAPNKTPINAQRVTARVSRKIQQRLECPDCGGEMKLRTAVYGPYYVCQTFPVCPGKHGANKEGKPLGTPADHNTRQMRKAAHAAFDVMWAPPGGVEPCFKSRGAAYQWMVTVMGLTPEEAHISRFDREMCKKLIEATWTPPKK